MKLLNRTFLASLLTLSPLYADVEEGFKPLFDGKTLEGWTSARGMEEGHYGAFSVNEEEQAIHVYAGKEANSKQETDVLNTKAQFSHFILKLEYKWLEKRFAPRPDWDRDAGLLFHVHGDLTKVWPHCLEMQIGESPGDKPHARGSAGRFHTGDLFVLRRDLKTDTKKSENWYDPEGELVRGSSVLTQKGVEKPKGEWNEMEIQVHGSEKAIFIFNGEVVLETSNFKTGEKVPPKKNLKTSKTPKNPRRKKKEEQIVEQLMPLTKGHIGLQAEWAEILYRNIRIKELPIPE